MARFCSTINWFRPKAMRPINALIGLGLLFSQSLLAYELVPFEAQYKASRSGMNVGHASQTLTHLGRDQYKLEYHSKASLLFLSDVRTEQSLFKLQQQNIIPYKYRFSRTGTGKDKGISLLFDKANQLIKVNDNATFPWQGEIDNQLYQLDVRQRLAKGEDTFVYDTINDRGELRQQTFRVVGQETLQLPYGKLDCIKVEKVRENSPRETFIWFSPALDYQMVRLQQFKDGSEQADIQLTHFSRNPG